MRIYNAGIADDAPLRYPPGVDLTPPAPVTRADIRKLKSKFFLLTDLSFINISWLLGLECSVISSRLGIEVPSGITLPKHKKQICEYMGAPGVPGVSVPIVPIVPKGK